MDVGFSAAVTCGHQTPGSLVFEHELVSVALKEVFRPLALDWSCIIVLYLILSF
jgi:hypothetical protein